MSQKISHDAKETAIAAMREHGTMQYGAKIAGVSVRTLNEEMRRSEIFKRRVMEARAEGKSNMADVNIQFIQDVATGKIETKMPRLTAALAITNAYEPGFRGTTTIQGKVEHEIRVIPAAPRPLYKEIAPPTPKQLAQGKEAIKIKPKVLSAAVK